MTDLLVVVIGGVTAGTLRKGPRVLQLDYDAAYRTRPDATPLSTSMPLRVETHAGRVVSTWLSGLLPENPDLPARWAREFGVANTPFDLLSTPVGEDCAGAAQFIRPAREDRVLDRLGRVDWLDERQVARRLAALRGDGTAWLGPDFTGQFSLAGAQAKTALHFDGRRWGVPSGATPTTHILKPAVKGLDDHDLNEHLCMDAAARVGLVVAHTRIARFADQTAVVVDRYDRRRTGRQFLRVHQEDLCQALGVPPERKYQADGGPSVVDIARLLGDVVKPVAAATTALESLLDALAWNWIVGGTDAHAKNYSLLLSADQVRLAPLYDIASVLPYEGVDELKLRTAMKLGGEYRLKAHNGRTWSKVASALRLDGDRALVRVAHLAAAAPDAGRRSPPAPQPPLPSARRRGGGAGGPVLPAVAVARVTGKMRPWTRPLPSCRPCRPPSRS
jgi:serine/threonine-protein kinase HipA